MGVPTVDGLARINESKLHCKVLRHSDSATITESNRDKVSLTLASHKVVVMQRVLLECLRSVSGKHLLARGHVVAVLEWSVLARIRCKFSCQRVLSGLLVSVQTFNAIEWCGLLAWLQ